MVLKSFVLRDFPGFEHLMPTAQIVLLRNRIDANCFFYSC
jgi:hypothetical protein